MNMKKVLVRSLPVALAVHSTVAFSSTSYRRRSAGVMASYSHLASHSPESFTSMITETVNNTPLSEVSSTLSALPPSVALAVDPLMTNPTFWTSSVLLIIVGMLVAWDTIVERAREATPPAIASVIDNILIEMGSLGFIGLVLSAILNNPVSPLQTVVQHLSQDYLGDEELLLESFHFLHELFFQAAIVYFFGSAWMTQRVIDSIEFASDLAEEHIMDHKKRMTGDDSIDEESLAMEDYQTMLREYQDTRNLESKNVFVRELTMPMTERGTEALVIRERIQQEVLHLPEWFRLDKDLEEAFATQELNLIKIAPSTWLPLIPILALAASVDLSKHVANPGATEAVASSGYYLATPSVFYPLLALQLLKLGWGLFNFWKMATIKDMLIPRLLKSNTCSDSGAASTEMIAPARGENEFERENFSSTPWFINPIESIGAKPSSNRVQELFGTIGGNGIKFYFESIKLHTWLCVATLVAFAFQIIPRDLFAYFSHAEGVGLPSMLGPELIIQGAYAVMNLVFLFYVSPIAFMNFAIISCAERAVRSETPVEAEVAGAVPTLVGSKDAILFSDQGAKGSTKEVIAPSIPESMVEVAQNGMSPDTNMTYAFAYEAAPTPALLATGGATNSTFSPPSPHDRYLMYFT